VERTNLEEDLSRRLVRVGVLRLPRSGSSSGVSRPRRGLGAGAVGAGEELLAGLAVLEVLLLGGELVADLNVGDGVFLRHTILRSGGVLGQGLGARAPVLVVHGGQALVHAGELHGSRERIALGEGVVAGAVHRETARATALLAVVAGAGKVAGHVDDARAEAVECVAAPALVALLHAGHGPAGTSAGLGAAINADSGIGELLVLEGGVLVVAPASAVGHVASVDPLLGNGVEVRTAGINSGWVGVRVVTVLGTGVTVVESDVVVAVEVVVEETRLTGGRVEHETVVVRGVDQVDGVAVVASRVGAGRTEPVDEVEEALVAVGAGSVGTAGGAVVAHVLQGAGPGNLLRLEVLQDGVGAGVDEVLVVGHGVVLEVGETVTVDVVVGAVGNVHGAEAVQPGVAARVTDPVDDAGRGFEVLANGGVALHHLTTHGVANKDNALHVGEHLLVVVVLDDLVKHVESGDLSLVRERVLVVTTSRPLRTGPDENACVGAAATAKGLIPRVCEGLVSTAGEVGGHDGDSVAVDSLVEASCQVQGVEHLHDCQYGRSTLALSLR
jgi:hypothetical protein